MHVTTANVLGNPNIGLYAFATDEYCILGTEAESLKELIEEVLQVPVILTTIAGTSMAGVFLAGTHKRLFAPNILFDHERKALEQFDTTIIETTHTALGNIMACTVDGCVISAAIPEKELQAITSQLKTEYATMNIAETEVTGSTIVATSKGCLVHRDATDFQIQAIKETLNVPKILTGSVNLGTPYVKSGIIANKNGFLIGSLSGGPEITNADEAFGFIE